MNPGIHRIGAGLADTFDGGKGDDLLSGAGGDDALTGGEGSDLLEGQGGADTLLGGAGHDALFGGDGDDLLLAGAGAAFLAGGTGRDLVCAGTLGTVVAFNRGDGCDTVETKETPGLTISLGGGISRADLRLRRVSDNLYLDFDAAGQDSVCIAHYFDGERRTPLTLQFATPVAATAGSLPTDPAGWSIERFDGLRVLADFDAAAQRDRKLLSGTPWSGVMNSLLRAQYAPAPGGPAMIGGDLAFAYASRRIAGMPMTDAVNVLRAPDFGSAPQLIHARPPAAGDSPVASLGG